MEKHAKKFWTNVAMDIIEKTNEEMYIAILFRDNYRDQPWRDAPEVMQIAKMLNNLNLDI